MKKEDLLKIEGVNETLATIIAEASAEELKGYIPKTRFDEVNEAKKNAESLVKERDKQLEEVKESYGNNEELKKQIETLQAENTEAKKKYDADLRKMQIDNSIQSALKDSGAKNIKAIMALLDVEKAEIGEDGTIKGLSSQIEGLQKSDAYLFNLKQEPQKPAGMTPANGGVQTPGNEGSWATKLAEARQKGDTVGAIAIKREAFQTDKVVLL